MSQYTKKKINVLGSQMAYVDVGEGPVALFLHGNPTSSYIWRNVIPHLMPRIRCIAPDLMGFGDSDKPDIDYRVADHARYLERFIETLNLDIVVFVVHDWGTALGFDWARRHENRVRGLAFMEHISPMPTWFDFYDKAREFFQAFRDPQLGDKLLIEDNAFLEKVLPSSVIRTLSPEVHDEYRRPFLIPAHRKPVRRFPCELPIAGEPADVYAMATAYHNWLMETEIPKLLFWAKPGALISPEKAAWYQRKLKNCRSVELARGIHYLQEDDPDSIGQHLVEWVSKL